MSHCWSMAALVGMLILLLFAAGVFAVILLLVVPVAFGGLWLQRHRSAQHGAAPAERLVVVPQDTGQHQVRAA